VLACDHVAPSVPSPHQGVIELERRILAFETAGRITSLTLSEGQRITVGERLGGLDDALIAPTRKARLAEIDAAKAQLALLEGGARAEDLSTLRAQVRALQANEQTFATALRRQRRLVTDGTAPESSTDDLEGRLRAAKAQREAAQHQLASATSGARPAELDVARAKIAALEAALEADDVRATKLLLTSPMAGVVLDVLVDVGEVVGPGTPVALIADPTHPQADIFVATAALTHLAVGQPIELLIDSPTLEAPSAMRSLPGRIAHIAATPEFTPRFVFSREERAHLVTRVRVTIDDPEHLVHAGMPVFAKFGGLASNVHE
jgi:HlyD family secretion protein